MKQVTYLKIGKHYRAYNAAVRKSLTARGIAFELASTKYGYRLLVEERDLPEASVAVLSIPFKSIKKSYNI